MPPRKKPPANPARKNTNTPFPKPSIHPPPPCLPPARAHSSEYHYPLLLLPTPSSDNVDDDGKEKATDALLSWFKEREGERCMPWRKGWVDPGVVDGKGEEGKVVGRRAYEVWVSEVMLQQTRVSTVIPYFNAWISKWPTIHDLANADHDDVLAAWKGLGYYSRATRLHDGAKAMISQHNPANSTCPIPSTAEALQQFPGIGRYTAGAVSSIAFGVAEPVLDGNVVRVLSRQLGIYADGKDKKVSDKLWEVADQLVKYVSNFPEVKRSAVPGQWNQALMELGSTVCTPLRPKCDECPVRKTCRAYAEGVLLVETKKKKNDGEDVRDIEDLCTLCEQLDTEDLVNVSTSPPPSDAESDADGAPAPPKKKRKIAPPPAKKQTNTISHYFSIRTRQSASTTAPTEAKPAIPSSHPQNNTSPPRPKSTQPPNLAQIQTYATLFPKKPPKKKPAEQSALICLIELPHARPNTTRKNHNTNTNSSSSFLIEQRPSKGLLASLWQFPQHILPTTAATTTATSATSRREVAEEFVKGVLKRCASPALHPPSTLQEKEEKKGTKSTPLKRARKPKDKAAPLQAKFLHEAGTLTHIFTHIKLTMHVLVFRLDLHNNNSSAAAENSTDNDSRPILPNPPPSHRETMAHTHPATHAKHRNKDVPPPPVQQQQQEEEEEHPTPTTPQPQHQQDHQPQHQRNQDHQHQDQQQRTKWVPAHALQHETLSTGMRKCWELYYSGSGSLGKSHESLGSGLGLGI